MDNSADARQPWPAHTAVMTAKITRNLGPASGTVRHLLDGLNVSEHRLEVAGIPTTVLQAGNGHPVVLLHEQGEFAARWMRMIPGLAHDHLVIAPDLPGHSGTGLPDGSLDAERVLAWLADLVARTCQRPPILVGHMLGGAIAARFAIAQPERVDHLVLIDTFGLRWFRPSPRLALALVRYIRRPTETSFDFPDTSWRASSCRQR